MTMLVDHHIFRFYIPQERVHREVEMLQTEEDFAYPCHGEQGRHVACEVGLSRIPSSGRDSLCQMPVVAELHDKVEGKSFLVEGVIHSHDARVREGPKSIRHLVLPQRDVQNAFLLSSDSLHRKEVARAPISRSPNESVGALSKKTSIRWTPLWPSPPHLRVGDPLMKLVHWLQLFCLDLCREQKTSQPRLLPSWQLENLRSADEVREEVPEPTRTYCHGVSRGTLRNKGENPSGDVCQASNHHIVLAQTSLHQREAFVPVP
mmetsp:Transcript_50625/g.134827  ORF Transcript_50625/g.134827 Transcript_50625/m.134827 type:complete len:262 (-) Transcript_50625:787-1572(-)